MKYIDFGIYATGPKVLIVMLTGNKDWIYLVHFKPEDFKELTNEAINETIRKKVLNLEISRDQVQHFNIFKYPIGLFNYGFLGEIKEDWVRSEMYKFVETIKPLNIV